MNDQKEKIEPYHMGEIVPMEKPQPPKKYIITIQEVKDDGSKELIFYQKLEETENERLYMRGLISLINKDPYPFPITGYYSSDTDSERRLKELRERTQK